MTSRSLLDLMTCTSMGIINPPPMNISPTPIAPYNDECFRKFDFGSEM